MPVIDRDFGFKRIMKSLPELAGVQVLVGVFGDEKREDPTEGTGGDATNADVAIFMEFGTESSDGGVHVPERPFLRTTVDEQGKRYADELARGVGRHVDGTQKIDVTLRRIGLAAVADVQRKIVDGDPDWPEMADSTYDAKSAKTRAGSDGEPRLLIDSGQLRQSIAAEVQRNGSTVGARVKGAS